MDCCRERTGLPVASLWRLSCWVHGRL
jgi:hypothetical protein